MRLGEEGILSASAGSLEVDLFCRIATSSCDEKVKKLTTIKSDTRWHDSTIKLKWHKILKFIIKGLPSRYGRRKQERDVGGKRSYATSNIR